MLLSTLISLIQSNGQRIGGKGLISVDDFTHEETQTYDIHIP